MAAGIQEEYPQSASYNTNYQAQGQANPASYVNHYAAVEAARQAAEFAASVVYTRKVQAEQATMAVEAARNTSRAESALAANIDALERVIVNSELQAASQTKAVESIARVAEEQTVELRSAVASVDAIRAAQSMKVVAAQENVERLETAERQALHQLSQAQHAAAAAYTAAQAAQVKAYQKNRQTYY